MNSNRDNATTETALSWTSRKVPGAEGLTHRATATIGEDSYAITVDSPRKGQWVARGWKNGDFDLYRETRTMKDAKAAGQTYVEQAERKHVEAQQDGPDLVGTLPDGTVVTVDHKTADESREVLGDAIPVELPDMSNVTAQFRHMADELTQFAPRVVHRAALAMRQFGWHLRRRCTCPTPSHRMSCGEGGRVRVVESTQW